MSDTAIVGEHVEVIQTGPGAARSAFSWSVAIAGALAAIAVSFLFISLGSGIGLAVASPYTGPSLGAMTAAGAIWLLISQTFGYATGGYVAGRLRIRTHSRGRRHGFGTERTASWHGSSA